jgi:DNA-binding transcriptional MocR family regulator
MTEGQPRLRAAASGLLAQRGIRVEENELVITTGSQQAIDLTARSILNEGDLVAVERPTYVAALQAFDLNSPRYVSIPVDQEGGQVQKLLEFASSGTLPKLVYLVPNFANPSGACLSLERRVWLARFAVQHGVFVLEDDPYGELRLHGSPLPSIYEIARSTPGAEKWCAYLTTLSKTMSPGLRIGALAGPEQFIDKITLLKQAADLHTSSFNQEVAARYLEGDRLQGRLDLIRREYRERQNCLIDEITSAFGSAMSLLTPEGGMFLWGRFRDGTDTRELLKHAIAAGVIYVPGDCFYVEQPDRSAIRLNFSAAPPEVIRLGVARLKYAHERYLSAFNGSGSSERRLELLGQRVLARVQRST